MKTTLVNLHNYHDTDVIYIDRRSPFGNPFHITEHCSRKRSIELYQERFNYRIAHDSLFYAAVEALRGKKLACWCTPLPCHGDVIINYLENSNVSTR
jgi:hypothetical protein